MKIIAIIYSLIFLLATIACFICFMSFMFDEKAPRIGIPIALAATVFCVGLFVILIDYMSEKDFI